MVAGLFRFLRDGRAPLGGCVLLLLAGCESHSSLLAPTPAATELPPWYSVQYDSLFQTPRFVVNAHAQGAYRPGAPAPFTTEQAFQIVRGFVTSYAPVFRFRPGVDDFAVTWADGRDGENLVKVSQTYLGLEVLEMGYGTSVISNGEVAVMNGRFMPDIRVPTIPIVSPQVAAQRSVTALLPTPVTVYSQPERVIATFDRRPRLAWSTVVAQNFLTWTVFVDARSGEVLGVRQNFIIG